MSRVLLVSYHFPPSNQVGAQRPGRLARLLPTHGFEVDVVCASLERAVGAADPTQEHLVPEGSRIVRVDTPFVLGRHPYEPLSGKGVGYTTWWRARAHLESVLLTGDWSWRWGLAAAAAVRETLGTYDVVVADAPPFPAVVPTVRLARGHGIPVVLDLRDFWTTNARSGGAMGHLRPKERRNRWLAAMRNESLRTADHVVLTSTETINMMVDALPGIGRDRASAITNAVMEVDEPTPCPPAGTAPASPAAPIRICHTGLLAYGRDGLAVDLIRGMGVLRRRGGRPFELTFAGDDLAVVRDAAQAEGVADQVRVLGWVDRETNLGIQRDSDALVLLQPSEYADVAIPGKLFEYMGRRRPILAFMPEGSTTRLIRDHGLGRVISSTHPEVVADELAGFAADVRVRPILPPPPSVFSEETTVAQFAEVLRAVVGRKG
jgi:hypothetical protein